MNSWRYQRLQWHKRVEKAVRRHTLRYASVIHECGSDADSLAHFEATYLLRHFGFNIIADICLPLYLDYAHGFPRLDQQVDLASSTLVVLKTPKRCSRQYLPTFKVQMRQKVVDVVEDEVLELESKYSIRSRETDGTR